MWMQIGAFAGIVILFAFTVYLSVKYGSKTAQLENLKAEIKRQAEEEKRARKIMDNVRNMSDDDVRKRLRKIAGK
jgi:hypothetical protein